MSVLDEIKKLRDKLQQKIDILETDYVAGAWSNSGKAAYAFCIDGLDTILRRAKYSTCGNCGNPRTIEDGFVLECKNCGDDEYEIATVEDKQVP